VNVPILDDARLRAVSGGDEALELELVDMLIEEAEPLVADLQTQAERHDREGARESSHSLKGIAGNIGAVALRDAAAELDAALSDIDPWSGIAAHTASIVVALNGVRDARASRAARQAG
jgi:two-component system sensor histidine kinase/response regulator